MKFKGKRMKLFGMELTSESTLRKFFLQIYVSDMLKSDMEMEAINAGTRPIV